MCLPLQACVCVCVRACAHYFIIYSVVSIRRLFAMYLPLCSVQTSNALDAHSSFISSIVSASIRSSCFYSLCDALSWHIWFFVCCLCPLFLHFAFFCHSAAFYRVHWKCSCAHSRSIHVVDACLSAHNHLPYKPAEYWPNKVLCRIVFERSPNMFYVA